MTPFLRNLLLPILSTALLSAFGSGSSGLEITPSIKTFEVGKIIHMTNQQGDARLLIWSNKPLSQTTTEFTWLAVLFEANAGDFEGEMSLIFVDETGNETQHSYKLEPSNAGKELISPTIAGLSVEIYLGSQPHPSLREAKIEIIQVIMGDEPLESSLKIGGPELFAADFDWRPIQDVADFNIFKMRESIVRISAPVSECRQPSRGPTLLNTCTGFRVADNLFATSWHCVSEVDVNSCSSVDIEFGYERTYARGPLGKHGKLLPNPPTNRASENCEKIIYRNKNLDLAIIQTTTNHYNVWKGAPILEFAGTPGGFPFDGEDLRILHYPVLKDECGGAERFEKMSSRARLPVGLRLSGNAGPDLCRVVGYTPKDIHRYCKRENGEICNVSWPTYFPPNPKNDCVKTYDNGLKDRFKVAFRHRCPTCGGTSGAPVFTMHPSRKYKVIGVHQAGQQLHDLFYTNVAIRASAIADCIDVETLTQGKIVPNSGEKGSQYWPYCRSDGAIKTGYLNCGEANLNDLAKSQRKLCELELR